MPIVAMPDGTRVRFPDDMPETEIRAMIQKKFPEANPEIGGKVKQFARGAVQGAIYDPIEGIGQIIEHASGKRIPIPQSVRNWFDKVRENTEATGIGTAGRITGAVGSMAVAPELALGQVSRAGTVAAQAARARGVVPTLAELRAASTARLGTASELIPKYEEYARRVGKSAMDLTKEERQAAALGRMPPGPPSRTGRVLRQAATGAAAGAVQPVADPEGGDFATQKALQALTGGALGGLAGLPLGGSIVRHLRRHPYHYGPWGAYAMLAHPATHIPSLAILSGLAAQWAAEKAGPRIAGPLGAVAGRALSGTPPEETRNGQETE